MSECVTHRATEVGQEVLVRDVNRRSFEQHDEAVNGLLLCPPMVKQFAQIGSGDGGSNRDARSCAGDGCVLQELARPAFETSPVERHALLELGAPVDDEYHATEAVQRLFERAGEPIVGDRRGTHLDTDRSRALHLALERHANGERSMMHSRI